MLNRTRSARTGSERVSPRHPEVARGLGLEPGSPELKIAERYLVREDYIEPSGGDREDDSYAITQTGWEDLGYQRSGRGGAGGLGGRGCSVSRQERPAAQGSLLRVVASRKSPDAA